MGFFKKIVNFLATASLPTYQLKDSKLIFKVNKKEFYNYSLANYEIKRRHDSCVIDAYTINTEDIFLEYIQLANTSSWNGQVLSLYENFLKEKLHIKKLETIEKREINNYVLKTYRINDSFIFHLVYIYSVVSDLVIIDTKGNLYKNLLLNLDNKYEYKFEKDEKGDINFNISIVKENFIKGFFNANN